ncbi:type II toxin-antitoxin system RelE/ParE family toxin [sulfur-oxidizing endosymbiont of Gigantopelta aegis]|uniref:type II toxin-antitoxin system RelE/ParE family toxin n=1 Tax=sulfur-oxidizing endosymbiont of Gigantopelta aegis TaxID=2794934 RepID=UPI0018DC750A|nr:type II toxin-antitoxin system RelE/ParE family toxin [sulfur-oxidizing endosymbiont of Gigantopelta aegis]
MDYTIEWSPEAIEDLDSIAEYIARDSEFYAQAVVSKILSVSRKIPHQALIGRIVPEINNEMIRGNIFSHPSNKS